ncbi:MAG: ECF transporter S component [Clostridiales bacterium]|jgi:uncharacterized membrane protein|nr:ECF transporter S component [Clostridiales bacterium]
MGRAENRKKILFWVQFGLLLAIEAIFCFTVLGSIPVPPISQTTAMIPVIVTAIILGPKAGTLMGAFAGLFSLIVMTFMPGVNAPIAFVFTPFYSMGEMHGNFWSLVICIIPRILVGTVAGLAFKGLNKSKLPKLAVYSISGALGSLTNTALVLSGIVLFFGDKYASVIGKAIVTILFVTIFTNGIPEAVLSAVAAYIICFPIRKYILKRA